jgi:hypothetical protein
MNALLRPLIMVPGVAGCMVTDPDGRILAHAFRRSIPASKLLEAAQVLADGSAGLTATCGAVGLIDLRFGEARILVRPLAGAHLLFLCDKAVSLQPLLISAAVAAPKLEKLLQARPAPHARASHAVAELGSLHRLVQLIDAVIARRKLDRFRTRGEIAIRAGFALDFVEPDSLDEPASVGRLREAARAVLGEGLQD